MKKKASDAQPKPTAHAWSKESLLAKAQRTCDEMHDRDSDDWRFAHWSAIALELLARAALAHVSPMLLADQSKDKDSANNLLFALGREPKAKKFVPRSVDVTAVFLRLEETVPGFTEEIRRQCGVHMALRNEDLHSGTPAFDGLSSASWLPKYYRACAVLLDSMGHDLVFFLGPERAKAAQNMIAAADDASAKAVDGSIAAHEKVWSGRSERERKKASAQAALWAKRQDGHRHACPACGSDALVTGSPIAAPRKTLEADKIIEKQQYLPSRFECIACGLKIFGLPQLTACDLGGQYTNTSAYDAADYYAQDDDYVDYEPDNNEP